MRYVLLIYGSESAQAAMSQEQQQALFGAHLAYAQELQAKGLMRGGDVLLPTSAATSVRVRNGDVLTTHGPFAETAEHLGGYYIIEVAHLDEALEWAAKNPTAPYGTIEVRPLLDLPQG